jgi:hypothetical protein
MTNNKQQTALELFWNQLPEILPFTVDTATAVKLDEAYQQAKEMDKERIIQAYSHGWHDGQDTIIMTIEHIDKGGDERGLKYYEQL